MSEVMRGYVERGEIAGLTALVSRGDTLHVETIGAQDLDTGAPMCRDTIFQIMSMTKAVTATAAMILVEETLLRLDDPVDTWLPELADRKVLRHIDSPIDDTVAAKRAITLRDLLTLRPGLGIIMAPSGTYPIQIAIKAAGVEPSAEPIPFSEDEYMKRLGSLPLIHQPGEQWLYHTGYDILSVLIARVTKQGFSDFLAERIFQPLGMADTGFYLPEAKLDRLASCYQRDRSGRLSLFDSPASGTWSRPPIFSSELISTADDYLAFAKMLLNGGRGERTRILARPSVELMMTDQISPAQKVVSHFVPGFWDSTGWGFGGSIVTQRDGIAATPGRYGWDGGFGTSFIVDSHEEMIAILLIQRVMTAPADDLIKRDFLTLAYAMIDD